MIVARIEEVALADVQAPRHRDVDLGTRRIRRRDSILGADQEGIRVIACVAIAAGQAPRAPLLACAQHPEQVLGGEVLLVDVVRQTDGGEPVVAAEHVHVAARLVPAPASLPGVGLAECEGVIRAQDHVHGLGRLTVVDPREFRLVAQLVEDLDLLDHVRRQIPQRQRGVRSEIRLSVHEHLLDGLGVVHRDARQLGDQLLRRGVGVSPDCAAGELSRVTLLNRGRG